MQTKTKRALKGEIPEGGSIGATPKEGDKESKKSHAEFILSKRIPTKFTTH